MERPFNFSPGPATLPEEVLRTAAEELLNWHGCGMSVMEMSHRGVEFAEILEQAEADFRSLLTVPDDFSVLFMQGGGLAENAIVPMNLLGHRPAWPMDFVVTGTWSVKSQREASRYGEARVAADNEQDQRRTSLPAVGSWKLSPKAAYVHVCGNETIHGIEFSELPDLKALGCDAPLVVDFSSHVASRPIEWERIGLAFGGAQKNIGPAGLTLVVVRKDLLGGALPICPSAFNYTTVAENRSLYNTPPTYSIYMAGLVFQWLRRQHEGNKSGVHALEARNIAKAKLLYGCIDASPFYFNTVDPACRSRMNVPFFLQDERLNEEFLAEAKLRGLLNLKGHKSVGGMRASLYNAMPTAGVEALVSFMNEFAQRHG